MIRSTGAYGAVLYSIQSVGTEPAIHEFDADSLWKVVYPAGGGWYFLDDGGCGFFKRLIFGAEAPRRGV